MYPEKPLKSRANLISVLMKKLELIELMQVRGGFTATDDTCCDKKCCKRKACKTAATGVEIQ